jgi:predicted dehydrogenase
VDKKLTNRRSFVKQAGVATGLGLSAMLWSRRVLGAEKRVRCGFIGVGSRGTALLRAAIKVPDAEVAVLCDIQEIEAKKALEEVKKSKVPYADGVTTTADWRSVIEDKSLDAIFIATPQNLHVPIATEAVEAKRAVYCEKALGFTIQECFDIQKAVEKAGTVFQVGHQRHYSEMYINAKKLIDSGDIGKITQIRGQWHRNSEDRRPCIDPKMDKLINWRVYREFSGGLMSEFGAHQIDVVNWFLGAPPVAVFATGGIDWYQDGRDTYDNMSAIFLYPNGVKFVYTTILTSSFNDALEVFMGDQGTIETSLLFGGRYFPDPKKMSAGQAVGTPIPCHQSEAERDPDFSKVIEGGAPRQPCQKGKTEEKGTHSPTENLNAVKAFIACCQDGKKPDADVKVGVEAAVPALMANVSMQENRMVCWSEFVS